MEVAILRPDSPKESRNPARVEERNRVIEESNPRGITQSPIMGTTVRLAGRATMEKRWK